MNKFVVGLTGGIGSGKTTIANMFNALGIQLVDADIIAREVVAPNSPALNQIKAHFGNDIILPDGQLDRTKLRHKVFNSDTEKQWLNGLLHPLIRESILTQLNQCKGDYCLLVAPLLIENKLTQYVNRILVIDVEESMQLKRTSKRDNTDNTTIKKIIASQISRTDRLQHADDILDNTSNDLALIKTQVQQLHNAYLLAAKAFQHK